jgi:hypothetical protein
LFPLLLFAAFFWTLILAWNERRFEWRPLAYTTGGMVLGNIINPYFPQNLYLFWEHFITKVKVGSDFAVSVGGEWYPYSGQELLMNFPIALVAMLVGYILFAPRAGGKLPEKSTFFLMFVTVLLVSQFRSKRFAEYFPPFAILFAAFSWREFLAPVAAPASENIQGEPEDLSGEKKNRRLERRRYSQTSRRLDAGSVSGFVVYLQFARLSSLRDLKSRDSFPHCRATRRTINTNARRLGARKHPGRRANF